MGKYVGWFIILENSEQNLCVAIICFLYQDCDIIIIIIIIYCTLWFFSWDNNDNGGKKNWKEAMCNWIWK